MPAAQVLRISELGTDISSSKGGLDGDTRVQYSTYIERQSTRLCSDWTDIHLTEKRSYGTRRFDG